MGTPHQDASQETPLLPTKSSTMALAKIFQCLALVAAVLLAVTSALPSPEADPSYYHGHHGYHGHHHGGFGHHHRGHYGHYGSYGHHGHHGGHHRHHGGYGYSRYYHHG